MPRNKIKLGAGGKALLKAGVMTGATSVGGPVAGAAAGKVFDASVKNPRRVAKAAVNSAAMGAASASVKKEGILARIIKAIFG